MRIKRAGLGEFYRLKGKSVANPVKSVVFQKRDASWFDEAVAEAELEAGNDAPQLEFDVQGISCVGCVWLIERIFSRQPGALRIDVNVQLGKATMRWAPGKFDAAKFADELQKLGYPIGPWSDEKRGASTTGLAFRLGVCGALAMNTMAFTLPRYLGMATDFAFAGVFQVVIVISATLSLLIGGSYFIAHAIRALRARSLHMDLPISLGIIAAYAGSAVGLAAGVEGLLYFDFVSVFIFLMLLGRWVQQAAIAKNRNRLLGSSGGMKSVERSADGEKLAVAEIGVGDEFLIGTGAMAPVACELLDGEAEVSLEWINGEPEARTMKVGRRVPAGAVNITRAKMHVRALERHDDSLLAKLVAEEAPRANRNPRVEKLLRLYLELVLLFAFAGGIGWLASGAGPGAALQVFISVLVVSCPCALGLALPLADELVVSKLRKIGLFVRSADLWGRLASVRRIVFDKTGTLTLEVPELENTELLDNLDTESLGVLSTLVADSLHPVGKSLRECLAARGEFAPLPTATEEVVGQGVALVDEKGQRWQLGKPGWAAESEADCIFTLDGRTLAGFHFQEGFRPKARQELAALRSSGTEIFVLSGDRKEKVNRLARMLELPPENCLGSLDPEQKATWLRERVGDGGTLFVGDGANDSLAFDEATVRATPAIDLGVLESKSDFYFLGRGLGAIRAVFDAGKRRAAAVRTVATFAISYNLIAVALCLAGLMNPLLAAVLMPLSSIATLIIVGTRLRNL
ncbi:MAG: Cu2+-exporting ATPase [Verrucomicrobiales bacterium]|jgi:Cu2+-exporting ATPase